MRAIRVYAVAVGASLLFFVVITAITNHFIMDQHLGPLKAQFDAVALDHLTTHAPYAGRIDRIIAVRNETLRKAHYFLYGTWDAENDGFDALYVKVSLLPDESYLQLWGKSGDGFELTVLSLSYFAPLLASLGACAFFLWIARHVVRR